MKMTLSNCTRTCVACRTKDDKVALHRFTRINGNYEYDAEQKLQGRSIYVHDSSKCLSKFIKMKNKYQIDENNLAIVRNIIGENE